MITQTLSSIVNPRPRNGRSFQHPLAEHYRMLLRRLGWPAVDSLPRLRSIGITSSYRGEGVSTVATHLAATAAGMANQRVLLVDFNLRHPACSSLLRMTPSPGVAEALVRDVPLADVIQPTPLDNLDVLMAGGSVADPAEVYEAWGLADLIRALKTTHELVVFDLPAMSDAAGVLRVAGLLDGVILVVESERVRWQVARRNKELLQSAQAQVLGVATNKHQHYVPDWLYHKH